MANDFLTFATSGTANVYTNAEYVADADQLNGNQPGIAKSKLVNKAIRQSSIISHTVAQFIEDITGTSSVDDGTTATLLADLKLATKGMIGANIASASTTAIGGDATGDVMHITGTTTITSFGTSITGRKKTVIFDGSLTLTYNATSLILPTSANIATSAGDSATFVCINGALGYWKCLVYAKQDGTSIISSSKQIQPVTASVAANALTVAINPTALDFRDTTLASGAVTTVPITSQITLIVPSSATLGTTNGVKARLAIIAINNAGTAEVAIINTAGGNDLSETGIISTTAISAGATSNNVFYSTTARSNVAYRVVGLIEITEATAGTWATAPTLVQGAGGLASADMNSMGYWQTWQDVTTSRASNTTYTNTTGKPIMVNVTLVVTTADFMVITVGGVSFNGAEYSSSGGYSYGSFIVPAGLTYSVKNNATGAGTVSKWAELR